MFRTIIPSKDGTVNINGLKMFVRPFWLTPDAPNQTLNLAAVVGAPAYAPLTIGQEGPFEGQSFICESTRFTAVGDHEFLVMLEDTGTRKQLSNRMLHANTIFGTPGLPLVLPEYLFLHERRSLTVRMQNIFANANAVRFCIAGTRVYTSSASSARLNKWVNDRLESAQVSSFYCLTTTDDVDNLTVAAGATSYFFPGDADGYFECYRMNAVAYDATLGTMTGTFDFILLDAETGRQLSSGNLSNLMATGNAMLPHVLPEAPLWRPTQRIEIRITNTTPTGNPIDVYFTMIGRKVYA